MNCKSLEENFWGNTSTKDLLKKYGSPLYVYNENILRDRCREIKNLIPYPWFNVNYSIKANSNLELLKIIRNEGLNVDAMSPGEIFMLLKAGFNPSDILYIGNNVSADEMIFAIEKGVTVSVDSVAQLKLFGKLNPGGSVAVRFNPGVGAGHHEKVVTAGNKTKFGVQESLVNEVKEIAKKYYLKIIGINQHVGSLFLNGTPYLEGVKSLLQIASNFDDLEFVDLGGGFGIPYKKQNGEDRLDIADLGRKLSEILNEWMNEYGREIKIKVEPGRYIVAESGVLLGSVNSVKINYGIKYIGTDIGLNVLMRPVLYDSYHEIEVYRDDSLILKEKSEKMEKVTIVGNICESGDILAKDRELPIISEGDILAVLDAGAYGYSMCSTYNLRLRPAEILIESNGKEKLIRRRDTLEDLMLNYYQEEI